MRQSLLTKIKGSTLIILLTIGVFGGINLSNPVHATEINYRPNTSKFTNHKQLNHHQNKAHHAKKSIRAILTKRTRRRVKSRFISYPYITQSGRGNANDACEAASLLMALRHFGLAKHKNLKHFVKTIPRSYNPERGYTHNPYKFGTGASLYPRALLRVAKRYGAKKSYIIDDYYPYQRRGSKLYRRKASSKWFVDAILNNHPIVFEGGSRMQYGTHTYKWGYRGIRSDDVLLLYGYKHHRLYWTSPVHRHNRWGSTQINQFMYIINAPIRGPRAVAISK